MRNSEVKNLAIVILALGLLITLFFLSKSNSNLKRRDPQDTEIISTQSTNQVSTPTTNQDNVFDQETGIMFPNNIELTKNKQQNAIMNMSLSLSGEKVVNLTVPLQVSCEQVVRQSEFCLKGYVVSGNGSSAAEDIMRFLKENN